MRLAYWLVVGMDWERGYHTGWQWEWIGNEASILAGGGNGLG